MTPDLAAIRQALAAAHIPDAYAQRAADVFVPIIQTLKDDRNVIIGHLAAERDAALTATRHPPNKGETMNDQTTIEATDTRLNALDRAIQYYYGREATPDDVVATATQFVAYLSA